jgi:hypothetical protein
MRKSIYFWLNSTGWTTLRRTFFTMLSILVAGSLAQAGTLNGQVRNGTTNQPVSAARLTLMELQRGMVPIGQADSDAHGRFHFNNPALGRGSLLLEAVYQGVAYYQMVSPGDSNDVITVYDASSERKGVVVTSHTIMLQPQGSSLVVEEQYVVENQTKPPVSFYVRPGTFQFEIPEEAEFGQVSTWTDGSVATLQKAVDLPNHRKVIEWAFRPGKNVVRFSYAMAYSSNQSQIRIASPYAALHVFLAAPPTVQIASDGFSLLGAEEGYSIYGHSPVAAGTSLVVSISGTASVPSASSRPEGAAESSDATIAVLPSRLFRKSGILIAAIVLLMVLGGIVLWKKSATDGIVAANDSRLGKNKNENSQARAAHARASVRAHQPGMEQSLEEIKEKLFSLEMRRQAGTVKEADYQHERQEMEAWLRQFAAPNR